MNLRALILETIQEALMELPKTITRTARIMIAWSQKSRHTCDRFMADSNGDIRALFNMILEVFRRKGNDLISSYGEDEEMVYYDFATHYEKGVGYWVRMGEKIMGDLWGSENGIDPKVTPYDRFMMLSVRDDKLSDAIDRVRKFGWHPVVGERIDSLGSTALIVSPVEL